MKNNETKYKETSALTISTILYAMFSIGLIYVIIKICKAPITETGFFQSFGMKILALIIPIILLCIMISATIGRISGSLKSKTYINKENRKINKENPYMYYRELPNNYGIGVTSLLFDSKIENYKDIVAVILDLCAKKYLSLVKENDKYNVKVLKGIDDELLSNEKYILDLIISNNIKNINYSEWYNYCLQDGTNLGLYYQYIRPRKEVSGGLVNSDSKAVKVLEKIYNGINIFIGILIFIITLMAGRPFIGLLLGFLGYKVSYIALAIPFNIIILIMGVTKMGKTEKDTNYDINLNNHLRKTDKGIVELQKLISFKKFLSDFGNFVDKNPEEVVLWDRYLSYAQVFGLTNTIMKSGYKQLISNSSFQIDDIDNISINNIEIK